MQDLFITKIHVDKVRNIKNLGIELSETERKHLILTGKNGSGKTSLLEAIRDRLKKAINYGRNGEKLQLSQYSDSAKIGVGFEPDVSVSDWAKVIAVYIPARTFRVPEITPPKTLEVYDVTAKPPLDKPMVAEIYKYLNNLKLQAAYPRSQQEKEIIEKWFSNFVEILREIYACNELELLYDAGKKDFIISMPGLDPFALNQMSDGYAAYLNIFMELLLRIDDGSGVVDFSAPAIVLIDEIETHLHVELQKRALPFLTKMFPNVQFIVATHSPFVITSIDNAVVFDLEKAAALQSLGQDTNGARLDSSDSPLTSYSYEDIVEGFYDISGYSTTFEREFARYKELCHKGRLTPDEKTERAKLKVKLSLIPASAKTLAYQIAQFEKEGDVNGQD
ncbi:MAG: AAA family ATPase [Fusobacteriaceae bacterium]|jgi:AAA15 family ATPase/GTPase|nr:AAA family ATPase [Fusobacteriaceae bacterium]